MNKLDLQTGDLFDLLRELPDARGDECFETVHEAPGLRIERIVSFGHSTPEGEWYDQEQDEWVMVLSGAAQLVIEGSEGSEGGERELELGPGQSVFLPAHRRHRVTWTAPDEPTIWLAVHHWPRR